MSDRVQLVGAQVHKLSHIVEVTALFQPNNHMFFLWPYVCTPLVDFQVKSFNIPGKMY